MKQKITDLELNHELHLGTSVSGISRKYGVSRQALHRRIKVLGLKETSTIIIPPIEAMLHKAISENPDFVARKYASFSEFEEYRDFAVQILSDVTHGGLKKLSKSFDDSFSKRAVSRVQLRTGNL